MLATPRDKLRDIQETSRRAEADIKGVVDCDVFIVCTDNQDQGKGMYAELGAALALNTATGRPKIFLVGQMNHMSIFYLHPAVAHSDSIEKVIEKLKD